MASFFHLSTCCAVETPLFDTHFFKIDKNDLSSASPFLKCKGLSKGLTCHFPAYQPISSHPCPQLVSRTVTGLRFYSLYKLIS